MSLHPTRAERSARDTFVGPTTMHLCSMLIAGAVGVMTMAQAKVTLTPTLLVEAPRPGSLAVNPAGTEAVVGVAYPSSKTGEAEKILYRVPLDKTHAWDDHSAVNELVNGVDAAIFLDNETLAFVEGQKVCQYPLSGGLSPASCDTIVSVPAPFEHIRITRTSDATATIVFAAYVYDDGDLDKVSEHDTSEQAASWELGMVYDATMVRHWDRWLNPHKRKQLFAVDIRKSATSQRWSADSRVRNLMKGTRLETPVGPLGGPADFSVSPHWVAFTAKDPDVPPAWHTRQQIYMMPLDGSAPPKRITAPEGHGWVGVPVISPKEDMVVFLQQDKDGFESDLKVLQTYSLETQTQLEFARDWDVSPDTLTFSPDGKYLYAAVTEDEQRPVYQIEVHGTQLGHRQALISRASASSPLPLKDGRLVYLLSSLHSPNDVYLREHNGETRRLTNFLRWSDAHKDIHMGPEPERFTWKGSDDVDMHGWILKPPSYEDEAPTGTRWPLAVLVHGGPEGDWNDGWSVRWNPATFAAAGFVVVTLDPSGSTGFGQAMTNRVLEHWGDRVLEDVKKGVSHILQTRAYVDPDRVVAAGASFGGYLINMLQGHNDDKLFKALVTHDGIFHALSMYYSTEETYFAESEFGGVPWEKPELYEKFSPHRFVSHWNTPHLIVHGGRDYRLSPAEGISAFHALQRRHVPSRLLFFPDEGHWVNDPRNSLKWHNVVLQWLQQWTSPNSTAAHAATAALVFQSIGT